MGWPGRVAHKDAVQQAYVAAFTDLASYRGEGSLKGWLSRIVINESLGRVRLRHSTTDLTELEQQQLRRRSFSFLSRHLTMTRNEPWRSDKYTILWSKRLTICQKPSL